MKAALKWTAVVVAVLVVVVIGALLVIPHFIDARQFKAPIEQYISDATGRPVSVGDDITLSLFPWAGASFTRLRVGNTPQFAEKDFLFVKSLEARVKLMPLLSKEVMVDRIIINEPQIHLVTNKDGRVSWKFGGKPAEATPPAAAEPAVKTALPIASLLVERVSIANGRLALIDHRAGSQQEISGINLELKDVSFDRPVHLTFSALVNQLPVSAEGRLGPVGANLGQGAIPVELKAAALGQLNLQLKGTVENVLVAPSAAVTIEVAEFAPRKLLSDIGQTPPATGDPNVLGKLALKANAKADATMLALSEGVLRLDDSTANFTLKAAEFSKPNLAFDVKLDRIDIDRYMPPKPNTQTGSGQSSAAPAAETALKRTDYSPLRKLVLSGSVAIGELRVSKATLEDVRLKVAAADGLLSIDPFSLRLYQGTGAGRASVNVKAESPVTDVRLTLDKVQANPLLKDVAQKDFLEGTAYAALQLTMSGDDAARIKRTLNGKGELTFRDGAIVGVDLAGMVRNVKAALAGEAVSGAKPRTDFAELAAPFSITNGVFNTPESSLKSPLLRLTASGNADLVQETMDFRVNPMVVGTIKGQGDTKDRSGLTVPVRVSGTFARPVFSPDLEALAKDQVKSILDSSGASSGSVREKAGGLIKGLLPGKQ
jgi:AsmA protein